MKKLLIYLFFTILLVGTISADLGTFRLNDCVDIKTILNSSAVNISTISFPNTTIATSNQVMDKTGQTFNYTFCDTLVVGTYLYDYYDTQGNVYVNSFEITPTGNSLNIAQGILYLFMGIVLILFFLVAVYGGVSLPFKNERNSNSEVIGINWKKYLKIFSWGMAYYLLIAIDFVVWNLVYAYAQWSSAGIMFHYIYRLLMAFALPVLIGIILMLLINYINDKKIEKFIKRTGLPYNG